MKSEPQLWLSVIFMFWNDLHRFRTLWLQHDKMLIIAPLRWCYDHESKRVVNTFDMNQVFLPCEPKQEDQTGYDPKLILNVPKEFVALF